MRRRTAFLLLTLTRLVAPARADELSLESIFGKHPLVKPIPATVEWLGNTAGVTFVRRTEGDKPHSELVLRQVPSGRERRNGTASDVCCSGPESGPCSHSRATSSWSTWAEN